MKATLLRSDSLLPGEVIKVMSNNEEFYSIIESITKDGNLLLNTGTNKIEIPAVNCISNASDIFNNYQINIRITEKFSERQVIINMGIESIVSDYFRNKGIFSENPVDYLKFLRNKIREVTGNDNYIISLKKTF